ncbi:MAG: thermonuclease family protein [Rickettsiales bacterium]|nr:thermonuclease family protein [Rickettsiales bacterium]
MTNKIYGNFKNIVYLRNYDGDTITVNIPNVPRLIGEAVSIRVRGLDTPEIKGKTHCEKTLAKSAKLLVTHLLSTAQIDLIDTSRDKYFRILSNVSFDGNDLSRTLIKNHLAVPYDGGKKEEVDWCHKQSEFQNTEWFKQISGDTPEHEL